ncbi:hypothetical protein CY34DRAFT_809030 [Suillus luteus UH-Slu-Lm8-n1]|uniref:Uncharacterized protein n=1 Tax=Suillus luteus UH-Slu-Lm8-n1 TaxID=930992 RepID=A0A0D0AAA9_9AGAM|nr:hypothetical protein CY34DRAFT_809030 [Suillus luteus UH-Slu-Lm8-n1]
MGPDYLQILSPTNSLAAKGVSPEKAGAEVNNLRRGKVGVKITVHAAETCSRAENNLSSRIRSESFQ